MSEGPKDNPEKVQQEVPRKETKNIAGIGEALTPSTTPLFEPGDDYDSEELESDDEQTSGTTEQTEPDAAFTNHEGSSKTDDQGDKTVQEQITTTNSKAKQTPWEDGPERTHPIPEHQEIDPSKLRRNLRMLVTGALLSMLPGHEAQSPQLSFHGIEVSRTTLRNMEEPIQSGDAQAVAIFKCEEGELTPHEFIDFGKGPEMMQVIKKTGSPSVTVTANNEHYTIELYLTEPRYFRCPNIDGYYSYKLSK